MNIINFTADTRKKSTMLVPNVVQNDSLNVFVIKVQEDRKDIELDDGITYTLTSADGVIIKGDKTGSNEVTFNIPGSVLKETGTVSASIQLYHEDGRISTLEFSYNVVRDLTGEFIPSDPEKTLIEIVLVEGPKVIQDAKDATVDANTATSNAIDATANANDGANRANTASGLIEPLLVDDQVRVSDADVQAQLATLNATQSQIIEAMQTSNDNLLAMQERLDGTFDTRVTGSIVEEDNPVPVKEVERIVEYTDHNIISGIEPEVWTPIFEDIPITGHSILRFIMKLYGVSSSKVEVRYTTTDTVGDYNYNSTSGVWLRRSLEREGTQAIVFEVLNPQPVVGKYMKIEAKHNSEEGTMHKTRALIQLNGGA